MHVDFCGCDTSIKVSWEIILILKGYKDAIRSDML